MKKDVTAGYDLSKRDWGVANLFVIVAYGRTLSKRLRVYRPHC